ncbi:hypothetical protein [Povalibacter sp.]|uniref:hypothetical protein n=1 Tax=Povalibacter sp. TaxID=1962978 RepID=UPI002F4263C8
MTSAIIARALLKFHKGRIVANQYAANLDPRRWSEPGVAAHRWDDYAPHFRAASIRICCNWDLFRLNDRPHRTEHRARGSDNAPRPHAITDIHDCFSMERLGESRMQPSASNTQILLDEGFNRCEVPPLGNGSVARP